MSSAAEGLRLTSNNVRMRSTVPAVGRFMSLPEITSSAQDVKEFAEGGRSRGDKCSPTKIRQWLSLKLLIFVFEPELREIPALDDEKNANGCLHDITN